MATAYTSAEGNEYVAPITSDSGNMFCVFSSYTLPSLTVGDTFTLLNIPRNANIVSLQIGSSASTSGATVDVGIVSDTDKFASDAALDGNTHELIGQVEELSESSDTQILATVTAAGTAASGKTLWIKCFYTIMNLAD